MTRIQTLLVTTALAAVLPFASAMAQTGGASGTKCGPETWSTDKMMYVDVPCVGAEAAQQPATVGAAAPMRQGGMYAQPQQASASGPAYSSMGNQSCGAPNSVAITDEFGHKYNCRGDRIR
jgi:hypothetical protein